MNTIDLLALAVYLFSGRLRPVAPFPDCGLDPTFGEGLSCETKGAPCLDLPSGPARAENSGKKQYEKKQYEKK